MAMMCVLPDEFQSNSLVLYIASLTTHRRYHSLLSGNIVLLPPYIPWAVLQLYCTHLPRAVSTIHNNIASGTESRCIRCKPRNDAAKLVRSSNPSKRVQARPLVQQIRSRIEKRPSHLGMYVTGRQRIHADLLASELACHTAGHL